MSGNVCSICGSAFLEAGATTVCSSCASIEQTIVRRDDGDLDSSTVDYDKDARAALSRTMPAESASAAGPEELGRQFGDYQILSEIARGGMGVVFKAQQISLNRPVALKMILSSHLASDDDVTRFRIEAEAAAKLEHPNIVPVHEVGQHGGQHFFSMGLVEGGSLTGLVEDGPLPMRDAAAIVKAIAQAVQYAHARNIVHRDLKPANVLMDEEGNPKVTDFGLAKNMRENSGLTTEGQVVGTPSYMPPEQAAGHVDEVGPLADVYALGGILYFLATGQPPFQGDTILSTLTMVLNEEAESPRLHNADVDLDLATICLKCLEKEPGRRYSSAGELAVELQRYLNREPILARPLGRTVRTVRWFRRNPVVASLITAVIVLLLVGSGGGFWMAHRDRKLRESAEIAQQAAQDRLVRQYVADGIRRVEDGDLIGALPYFVDALELESDDPSRAKIHRYRIGTVLDQCPKPVHVWFHDSSVLGIDISANGARIVAWCEDGTVQIRDAESGQRIASLTHKGACRAARISDDMATVITACDDGQARLWNVDTPTEPITRLSHAEAVSSVALSPDGHLIATGSLDKTARVWDARTGEPRTPPFLHRFPVQWVDLNADGTRLVAATGQPVAAFFGTGEARIWNVETGQPIGNALHHDGNVQFASFSDDGKRVVTVGDDFISRVWSHDATPLLPPLKHDDIVTHAVFSPDGRRLVTAGDDDTARIWDVETGMQLVAPLRHPGEVRQLAMSPDGRLIASACLGGTAHVWDSVTGVPVVAGLTHSGPVNAVRFSPDAHRLVTASSDGTVRVWDLSSAEPDVQSIRHDGRVRVAAFTADGDRFMTGGGDGKVQIRDSVNGELLTTITHAAAITSASFHPSGDVVVVHCQDRRLYFWQTATGDSVSVDLGEVRQFARAKFPPQADRLVTIEPDGSVTVWRWPECKTPIVTVQHPDATHANMSRDGELLVTRSRQVVNVWIAHTGEQLGKSIELAWPLFAVCISPDGRWIGTAGGEQIGKGGGEARLWNSRTGEPLGPPFNHAHGVGCIVFDPAGKRVATGSFDNTARVWDAQTGRPLTPSLQHNGDVLHIEFSQDGLLVATASDDLTARVWNANTGEAVTPPLPHRRWVRQASFSPNEHRLLTLSVDSRAHLFSIPRERRSLSELYAVSQALTGQQRTPGGSVKLTGQRFEQVWESVSKSSRKGFRPSIKETTTWYQRQLGRCVRHRQWPGVVWNTSELLRQTPTDGSLLRLRGRAYAELSMWPDAMREYQQAAELSDTADDHALALLQLASADTDAFARTCQDLLARKKEDDSVLVESLWTCVISPHGARPETVAQLVQKLVSGSPTPQQIPIVVPAANYRAGAFAKAAEQLDARIGQSDTGGDAWDWLFLAMAHQRLGNDEESRQWFRQAVRWIERETNERTQGQIGARLTWQDRLELNLLRQEYEKMGGK